MAALLTVFAVVHDLPVEAVKVLGVSGEGGGVARHGVPRPHRQQLALLVLRHQVLKHGAVVYERVQLTARGEIISSNYQLHVVSCRKCYKAWSISLLSFLIEPICSFHQIA